MQRQKNAKAATAASADARTAPGAKPAAKPGRGPGAPSKFAQFTPLQRRSLFR
jgi:hypothetical protein